MLFNSLIFFIFLPIVFAGYWWIGERRWQNAWLLVASEVFMDGGLVFSHRCLFDDQLGGRRFIARTEMTRKRHAVLMAC